MFTKMLLTRSVWRVPEAGLKANRAAMAGRMAKAGVPCRSPNGSNDASIASTATLGWTQRPRSPNIEIMEDTERSPVSPPPFLEPPVLPRPVSVEYASANRPPAGPQATTSVADRRNYVGLAGVVLGGLALLVAAAAYFRANSDHGAAAADKANADIASLHRSTQSAFDAVGPQIGKIGQDIVSLKRSTQSALDAIGPEIGRLKDRVQSLQVSTSELQRKTSSELEVTQPAVISLTPKSVGVARNEYGAFLVSIEDAQPCVDGYKVRFRIGNLAAAAITKVSLSITYGLREPEFPVDDGTSKDAGIQKALQDYGRRLLENQKSRKTVTVDAKGDFPPASWNFVDVVISPAKLEEFGRLTVLVNATGVTLALAATPNAFSQLKDASTDVPKPMTLSVTPPTGPEARQP
jgi:hypothetical protein